MRGNSPFLLSAFVVAACGLFGSAISHAATAPYLENFDDETVGATAPSEGAPESGSFSVVTSGLWAVQAGDVNGGLGNSYRNAYIADNTVSLALIDFAGSFGGTPATANDFTVSTDIRFNTGTLGNATAGIGFLMNSSGTGYFVDVTPSGLLRIIEGGTVVSSDQRGVMNLDAAYTMTLTGTYVDSNADTVKDQLNISVSVAGPGMSSTAVTFNDTSISSTNSHFGFRNRNNASDLNVSFDNFNVSVVPEPGSSLLFIAGAGAAAFVRRRKVSA